MEPCRGQVHRPGGIPVEVPEALQDGVEIEEELHLLAVGGTEPVVGGSLWIDQVTMPAPPMIDVHRSTFTRQTSGEAGETRVEYIPTWNDIAADYLDTEEGRRLASLSVEQVFRELGPVQPTYEQVEAVTGFSVTVRLDGRERTYRAAVLWGPDRLEPAGDPGASFGAMFVDHVTQGVSQAAIEKLEPMT